MTTGGWVMLTLSWIFIIGLTTFCMQKVIRLRNSEAKHIKPITEIDTGDLDYSEEDRNQKQLTEDISGAPIYFAISPMKLVVMSICTMGIYQLYWFYKNWVVIKGRERSNIMPFWRAFFAFVFCYSLFKKVQASSATLSLEKLMSPGLLAIGYIIISFSVNLPNPFWLIMYFAVILLLPVQTMVNNINDHIAPGHDKNDKFTGWNIFGVVGGGLFFLLIMLSAFMPPE